MNFNVKDMNIVMKRCYQHIDQVSYNLKSIKKELDYEYCRFQGNFLEKARAELDVLAKEKT